MSWVDCSMRLRSGRREGLLPGTWTIGSCKHPASAYSKGCAVRERDSTHSEDHPRNEGGDEETVRHDLCKVCGRMTECTSERVVWKARRCCRSSMVRPVP